jgi:uncharacterized membrane protein YbhN (UPF0104 family)/tRNA A-37 threonylcarbamoyl transferase component Bud32
VSIVSALRRALVRDREESVTRRRPGDAVRILVAAASVGLLSWHAGHLTAAERAVSTFFHSLPDDAGSLLRGAYALVSLWALGIVVVAVLLLHRWRLARDVLLAGSLAWLIGRLLAFLVHETSLGGAFQVVFDPRDAPRFPTVRLGLAVAVIAVAGPYLTRPLRRVGQGLVAVLALTALYLGSGVPTDVLAALALGWGVAAAVHLAFGTPLGRPTVEQVGRALAGLGLCATYVREAANQPLGRALLVGELDGAPLRIVAIGRDEADAQLINRAWRFLAYRDAAPILFPTRRQQVEYEAYVVLLAAQFGVPVPRVLLAAAEGSLALLVTSEPFGRRLADLDPELVTDTLLETSWRQVQTLVTARIAHGALDGEHVVVDEGRVTFVDWAAGSTDSGTARSAGDIAQFLAATAAIVGPDRAVDAAARSLDGALLAAAVPHLQPAALSSATRDVLDHGDGIDANLAGLRSRAAATAGVEEPELRQLLRVNPRSLLMAVGALVGVGVLLSRVGDPVEFWNSIRDASWAYIGLAFVLGILTDVAFAFAFIGTVPARLPIWDTIELQSSLSFANLAIPVAADTAMQVRFLQKNGLDLSEAVATGGVLSTVSELIVQAGLFVVALLLAPSTIHFGHIDTSQIVVVVLIAIFVLGVAVAVVAGVRRVRSAVLPAITRAALAVWGAIKTPSRIALMLGGNVAAQCLYAASLLSCLSAFGHPVDFWSLLAMNIGISLIASLVPVPGGGTAVAAIGLSGMLVTLGVPTAAATAAVLSHQLAVSYLPAIPGWFASNDLVRRHRL